LIAQLIQENQMKTTSTPRLSVLLADDHVVLTEGIRSLLEPDYGLLDVATDGRQLVEAALTHNPDLIVADISMPALSGIEALREIRAKKKDVKMIFLTMHKEPEYAAEAFRAGASGYVLKTGGISELKEALRCVSNGTRFLSPDIEIDMPPPASTQPYAPGITLRKRKLTPRQIEVLQLVAAGKSGKEIASILKLSIKTVEFHKYRMTERLNLHTAAELTRYAIKEGLVPA
jgi:DNA-binding NarL/FixJ family response regulator